MMKNADSRSQRKSALLAFIDVDLSKFDAAETSSDESYKIENHTEDSGSDFGSSDEGSDEEDESDASEENSSDEPESGPGKAIDVNHMNEAGPSFQSTGKLLEYAKTHINASSKLLTTPVCCACLNDRSDDSNEIVECDGCHITVHEGCYGVSESVSVSSTVSSCSTEPWFCEACKANVKDPDCELCPNRGGIFKETDCGKWVHLVCALYVPGVAFADVEQLSIVTLFEMQYNKWGAKACSLCADERFARTGVCIGCDAGLCKTYFHVTCAQKHGFLSEAHHDEADQADPFYAHCKAHSDTTLMKNRKRNYNTILLQMKRHEAELEQNRNQKPTPEQERIERKLKKHRAKYITNKQHRVEPWVPTQKMPRLLNTTASACKKLMRKAELMGIDAAALEFQEAQIASLTDIRKKWHIPPAFSTEFVGYYLDRSIRIKEMKTNLTKQVELNQSLTTEQQFLRTKYDDSIKINHDIQQHRADLIQQIEQLHGAILQLAPHKHLQAIESIGKSPTIVTPAAVKAVASPTPTLSSTPPPQLITSRTMTVPTAAALKMGVGFPLTNLHKDDTGKILSTQRMSNDELLNECGICKKCTEQHLLAKCDTCNLYYHLGCLNPPLTRQPKRSKLYTWQCSECDKSDDSAPENVIIPKGPRRSRVRYSKDGIYSDPLRDSFGSDKSLSLSRKSEDSHPIVNGTETDTTQKTKTPDVPNTAEVSVNESFVSDIVPTTSTPIAENKMNSEPKKRGRKPKQKPDVTAAPVTDIPGQSEPSKETEKSPKKRQPKQMVNSTIVPLTSEEPPKLPKKGRPRKEKSSIAQISEKLQQQQELTLLDLSRKVDCPLENHQAFADIPNSIPYPAPTVESSKILDDSEPIPVLPVSKSDTALMQHSSSDVISNGVMVNGDGATSGSSHYKPKKIKKKRRHSHSPSSLERNDKISSGKKHKQKHKDKNEIPLTELLEPPRLPDQPGIKLKICSTFVQVGNNKKKMWSSLRTADNEAKDEFHQTTSHPVHSGVAPELPPSVAPTAVVPMGNGHSTIPKRRKKPGTSPNKKARLALNISLNKGISSPVIAPSHFTTPISSSTSAMSLSATSLNESLPTQSITCDVCHMTGTNVNIVKCDECQKNYHFMCLIPPLKKTPKKRGYSWHCADCDPTDRENN